MPTPTPRKKEKNRACPKCKEIGHDKHDNHLYLMKDGVTWHCDKDYHAPYYEVDGEERELIRGETDDTPADFIGIESLASPKIRDIRAEVIALYGIKVEFDTTTGEPVKHYYPITTDRGKSTISWKLRKLPKEFSVYPSIGTKKVDLFGMLSYPFVPKVIIICEGELDACASYQMLKPYLRNYMCLSLPFGGNIKPFLDNLDFLKKADEVVYCPDQDDVGLGLLDKLCLIMPEMKVMRFSEKDACDMLKEGKQKEFLNAYETAEPYKPSAIVTVEEIILDALEPVETGISYPYIGLTTLTYGCSLRSIIGIGAGPGAGKTSFIKGIESHLIHEHNKKVGIFALEESPAQTLRSLGGYIIEKPVHLPDCKYDSTKLSEALLSLRGKVFVYDHRGYRSWQDIANAITYMAHLGVQYFFIDPLSALVAHLNASDANTYLNSAMFDMSKLVHSLDITIFHVNHLNNPVTGKDHGAGGKVYGSQFSGSRAMWKFSTDLWGLERNQLAEDKKDRDKVRLVIIKNRLSGITGSIELTYDRKKGKLIEGLRLI